MIRADTSELSQLLETLLDLGVQLKVENGTLSANSPPGAITENLARQIREHKSVLIELLQQAKSTPSNVSPMQLAAERDYYPLSLTQRQALHFALRGPGLPTAFRLRGDLDPEALNVTLNRIVQRHAPLRSVFCRSGDDSDGEFMQRVSAEIHCEPVIEFLAGGNQEVHLHRRLQELAREPFDLEQGPLFRFSVIRLSPQEHVLFACFSPLIFDGWSFDVFLEELTSGYAALSIGQGWPLAPLEREYVDYVYWQSREFEQHREEQREFWSDILGDELPAGPIPVDLPRKRSERFHSGSTVEFALPDHLLRQLRSVAREHDITMQMLMLAGLFLLMQRLSSRERVVIAAPVEGRRHPHSETMMGSFVNILLLSMDISEEFDISDLLSKVKQRCLAGYDHQDIPVSELELRLEPHGNEVVPLWQVEFSYQQVVTRSNFMGNLALSQVEVHSGGAANELALWVKDFGTHVVGAFEYSLESYCEATVRHWRDCYLALLQSLCDAGSSTPVNELDILGDELQCIQQAQEHAMQIIPDWAPDIGSARIIDNLQRLVPLGVWGTFENSSPSSYDVRLTANGQLERRQHAKFTRMDKSQLAVLRLTESVRDPIEFGIIEEFAQVCGCDDVGLQEDFFNLGGHSLAAVKLVDRLHILFGIRFSIGVLFESPTPYLLAKLVRSELARRYSKSGAVPYLSQQSWSPIVPIQSAGSQPPLFVVAGIGGNPMNLRFLAKALKPDQPFYGLQHRGTDGRLPPHFTVEAAAREYASHITEVDSEGPYFLGGFSAGGIVAFETARVLQQRGRRVALVVMFDALSPLATAKSNNSEGRSRPWRRLFENGMKGEFDSIGSRLHREARRINGIVSSKLARLFPYRFRMEAVRTALMASMRVYSAKPLEVDVLVLRAAIRDNMVDDPTNGWSLLVQGNLEVCDVPGGHTTHIDIENCPETARLLKKNTSKDSSAGNDSKQSSGVTNKSMRSIIIFVLCATIVLVGCDDDLIADSYVLPGLTDTPPLLQCDLDVNNKQGQQTIQVNGKERSYWLVPPEENGTEIRRPLVLVFHGSGASGEAMYLDSDEIISNMPAGAVMVFPDGEVQDWYNGKAGWDVRRPDTQDLAFVAVLVNQIRSHYCIDDNRIYALGFSWGSWMTSALGCVFGSEIAGISVVSGGPPMFNTAECKGGGVDTFIVHGRSDSVEPFTYGEQALVAWRTLNGCEARASAPDARNCVNFENCTSGKRIRWCAHDGGHRSPELTWLDMWRFFNLRK